MWYTLGQFLVLIGEVEMWYMLGQFLVLIDLVYMRYTFGQPLILVYPIAVWLAFGEPLIFVTTRLKMWWERIDSQDGQRCDREKTSKLDQHRLED